ncbi:chromate transporter [Mycoplasmopsis lipofaciens]|uniref:chromate transporter n=1 Tax=Mycoplasmopsis lipofaciens TaxID=114884 RepID=UPI000560480F|nr:chromate transporter [Mycoplasmopsis lipofaciens]
MENNKVSKIKNESFWKVVGFILLITFIGFGGGNALMPIVRKYSVEKYKWLSEEEFEENVVITNMLPGPSIIEAVSYISIKLLGPRKALLAILIGALPHTLVAFVLIYFSKYIPLKYLYAIEVGVLVAVIGALIGFSIQYFRKNQIKTNLWVTLFLITFLFCLFVPSPYNIPVAIMFLIILTFTSIYIVKKRYNKKFTKKGDE